MFDRLRGRRRARWTVAALTGLIVAAVVGGVVTRNSGGDGGEGESGRTRPRPSVTAPGQAPGATGGPGAEAAGTQTSGGLALPRAGRGRTGSNPGGATPPSAAVAPATASPQPRDVPAPAPAPGTTDAPTAPTSPTTTTPGELDASGKRWVQVGVVSGTSTGRSPRFHLAGIDTRLVYRSEAGSFAVFLVDEVQGREATAGFAEVECERPCTGEMILVSPAGNYHLEVDTPGGAYEVAIEEYRRPDR